jgi:hypothetical protein
MLERTHGIRAYLDASPQFIESIGLLENPRAFPGPGDAKGRRNSADAAACYEIVFHNR